MPLQNRVKPNGEIVATPERGTMMGNRGGKFHREDQTLGQRRWASSHWICCDLHWKDAHHEPMGRGYTSLFFLDEVTALSAGHRPCFYCRRKEAVAFLGGAKVRVFDLTLHAERAERPPSALQAPPPQRGEDEKLHVPPSAGVLREAVRGHLPQGTMVELNSNFYAVKNQGLLRWSFSGYTDKITFTSYDKILTPPSIIAILQKGYQPRWHESAHQWG
jgi:hypothetical protein